MSRRKTEKDYHALAKSRGFKWVGEVFPKDTKYLTLWECEKCEYVWEAHYNSIQQGSGCPDCAGKIRKTKKDYYNLANSCGFKWVGDVLPKTTKSPTWWKCEKGDRWKATYNNVCNHNSGCPVCVGLVRKIEKDYYKLAKDRRFKWAGVMLPKNTTIPTLWECEKGDRWEAAYRDIQQGNGCPYCSGLVRKVEKDYHYLAEIRGFKWAGNLLPKEVKIPTWWECGSGHRWKASYNSIQQGRGCSTCKDRINGAQVSKSQRKLNNLLCGSLNYPEGSTVLMWL